MKRALYICISLLAIALSAYFTYQYASTHNIAVLEPKGSIAYQERELFYICSILMLFVVIPVLILLLVFAWKYRIGNGKAKYAPDWAHSTLGEFVWWGIPCIIICILGWITWDSTHELNPYKPIDHNKKPVTIQVVALNWKWLFIYPELGIATVNYIQFPVGTPLSFQITSDAPMNSFWIPQLGGQIYAMPGMRSKLHLIANEEGSFRGLTTNINGKGFAGMVFKAVATKEEDYLAWIETVKQSSNTLSLQEYNNLLSPSENNPVSYYSNVQEDLFETIVMKTMYKEEKIQEKASLGKVQGSLSSLISHMPGRELLPKFQESGAVCLED